MTENTTTPEEPHIERIIDTLTSWFPEYEGVGSVIEDAAAALDALGDTVPREQHAADLSEYASVMGRQRGLLTAAVAALRGPPPALTTWSHHDIADLARAVVDERDALAHVIEQVRASRQVTDLYMPKGMTPLDVITYDVDRVDRTLDAAPAVSLALHDAEVKAQAWSEGVARVVHGTLDEIDWPAENYEDDNPYRAAAAAAVREEAK